MSMEAAGCSLQLLEVAVYLYNPISGCRHVVEEFCLGVTEAHMHVTFDLSLTFGLRLNFIKQTTTFQMLWYGSQRFDSGPFQSSECRRLEIPG